MIMEKGNVMGEGHVSSTIMERAPQTNQNEQYPLLKVDSGGGDGSMPIQPTPALVTPSWGVTCTPKQSWLVRWPEYISACWMTLILLGISFLVFYSLGMEAYRRQPVLLIKSNETKPASDVFYHKILPKGSSVIIMLYSDYLSSMSYHYPLLHFHVYFLIDDSVQSGFRVPRHPRFINTLIPISLSNSYPLYKMDDKSKRELAEFQRKHHNINVTIMPLSKYMAMTPLKYKWRNMPVPYLTFYARVFSVWQYGGIGMDLCMFNNYFNNRHYIDRKMLTVLKQHNDGIKPEEYTSALNKIDREEETEFFTIFCGLVHSILNETRTFLSKTFPLPQFPTPEKDLIANSEILNRSHRAKREVVETTKPDMMNSTEKVPVIIEILNSTSAADLKNNEYQTLFDIDVTNTTRDAQKNDTFNIENIIHLESSNISLAGSESLNKSEHPQLLVLYDFSVFSDVMAPSVIVSDSVPSSDIGQVGSENKPIKCPNIGLYLLSLDSEGAFIASSSRLHPLLGHLISGGCHPLHPKFAIQDTLLTQCAGVFKEDMHCNNIYLL